MRTTTLRATTLRTLAVAAALVGVAACGSSGDDGEVSADGTTTTVAAAEAGTDESTGGEGASGADGSDGSSSASQSGSDGDSSSSSESSDGDESDAGQTDESAADDGTAAQTETPEAPGDGEPTDEVDPDPEPAADYSGNPYWEPGLEHKATYRVPVHSGAGDPIEQCLAKGGNPYYNPDAPSSSKNTGCSTGRNGRWDHPVPDYDPTIGALDTEIECAWKDAQHVRSQSLSQGKSSVQGGYQWIVYNASEKVCGSR